jgi:uncharacterized protein
MTIPATEVPVHLLDLGDKTEAIPYEDCHDLLASQVVGRLVVLVDGRVEIFPVNYGLDGDGIVFRTNAGTKLRGLLSGEVVFEVDHIDLTTRSGWSIIVRGNAQNISHFDSPPLRERAKEPWAGPKDFLVRITPRTLSGRRVLSQLDNGPETA